MTGRTHDLAAITALGSVAYFAAPQSITLATVLLAILFNQLGGIAPDIDQPTAPLWRNLPEGHIFGKIFDKTVGGHRFLTHSLLGFAIFGFLVHLLLTFLHPVIPHVNIGLVWWSFMIGMFSHLIMDSFTKEGVPWLLPLSTKFGFPPVKDLRVSTGKLVETLIIFPGIIALDAWFCASHYQTLVFMIHQRLI